MWWKGEVCLVPDWVSGAFFVCGLCYCFALRFRFGRVWLGCGVLDSCPLPPVALAPLPTGLRCYVCGGFVEVLLW